MELLNDDLNSPHLAYLSELTIYDGKMLLNSDGNTEGFSVGKSDNIGLEYFDSIMIVVADYSKPGEEIRSTEVETLGVPEWAN